MDNTAALAFAEQTAAALSHITRQVERRGFLGISLQAPTALPPTFSASQDEPAQTFGRTRDGCCKALEPCPNEPRARQSTPSSVPPWCWPAPALFRSVSFQPEVNDGIAVGALQCCAGPQLVWNRAST